MMSSRSKGFVFWVAGLTAVCSRLCFADSLGSAFSHAEGMVHGFSINSGEHRSSGSRSSSDSSEIGTSTSPSEPSQSEIAARQRELARQQEKARIERNLQSLKSSLADAARNVGTQGSIRSSTPSLASVARRQNELQDLLHAAPPSGHRNLTVVDLSRDEIAARISADRLRAVNSRIARLQKAIEVLSTSNPEWQAEWDHMRTDMDEYSNRLTHDAVDALTLEAAELLKFLAARQLTFSEDRFFREQWPPLPADPERLQRLLATTTGDQQIEIRKCIDSLNGISRALRKKDFAEALGMLWSAGTILGETYKMKISNADEALRDSSVLLGETAMMFAKGVEGEAGLVGSVLADVVDSAHVIVIIRQEQRQLHALSDQAIDRNHRKLALMQKVEDLEQERTDLIWAISKANGTH